MEEQLKIDLALQRCVSDFLFANPDSTEALNLGPEDGSNNWFRLDVLVAGLHKIKLEPDFKSTSEAEIASDNRERAKECFCAYLHLHYSNLQAFHFYMHRFARQAEALYGIAEICTLKYRLSHLVLQIFSALGPVKNHEIPLTLAMQNYLGKAEEPSADWLMTLYFILAMERGGLEALFELYPQQEARGHIESMLKSYTQAAHFLLQMVQKVKIKPKTLRIALSDLWLKYLDQTPEDKAKLKACISAETGQYQIFLQEFDFSILDRLPVKSNPELIQRTLKFQKDLKQILLQNSMQNQAQIQEYAKTAFKQLPLIDLEDRQVYAYYLAETAKVRWEIPDLMREVERDLPKSLSDNDYELLDVLKEIAYCEGIACTIALNNYFHCGLSYAFNIWNNQQGHEEMKHFHVIRKLLHLMQVNQGGLDEQYLADSFVEARPEYFRNAYDVVLINFLGEVHNIRAYLLLAQCFENQTLKNVLLKITDDEVVHKKVFAVTFHHQKRSRKNWENEAYQCMLDGGLEMHQAKCSPHYYTLMKKIGSYYTKYQKSSALKFLNQSMRAQYLELQSLFSKEIFTVSEFDFRRKHLKAYAFSE